ncbi:MAG: hypothetical protein V9E99_16950 [Microthrixaceae bacterium]|jgi:hypothetical protein|nr:hypothetical protein [Microthrixaceae bacterium]HMT24464.1 hypothetical protein [Microthrixaceae bacterium]HMT60422.1 hypothetical protein [Microthrixaceae bacterium]
MSIRSVLTLRRLAAPLTCATLALAGCGSDSTTKADVPSLNGSDASSEATTTTTIDPEEAAQNFVACLREQGIEVADPKVDSDGQIDMRSIFDSAGINPGDDSMRTAMDSCRDELANAGFGPSEEDSEARQEAMLAFTSCLRDEGLDVGDITFDGPGQGGPPSGAAGASGSDASGATGATGAGGATPPERPDGPMSDEDRTERLAEQLGLDASDASVTKAFDACSDELSAMTAGGPGGGNGGSTTTTEG